MAENNMFLALWKDKVGKINFEESTYDLNNLEKDLTKDIIKSIGFLEKKKNIILNLKVLEETILNLKESSRNNKSRFSAIIRSIRFNMKDHRKSKLTNNYNTFMSCILVASEIHRKINNYFEKEKIIFSKDLEIRITDLNDDIKNLIAYKYNYENFQSLKINQPDLMVKSIGIIYNWYQ